MIMIGDILIMIVNAMIKIIDIMITLVNATIKIVYTTIQFIEAMDDNLDPIWGKYFLLQKKS